MEEVVEAGNAAAANIAVETVEAVDIPCLSSTTPPPPPSKPMPAVPPPPEMVIIISDELHLPTIDHKLFQLPKGQVI